MSALKQGIARSPKVAPAVQLGPIGVDFSIEQLHMVQLVRHEGGEILLQARTSVSYPEGREALMATPRTLRSFVRRALRFDGFSGRGVVSALPPEEVRILSVAYHPGTESDARAILNQLDERLDGRVSDYVVDYLPVRTGQGDEERLAMVAVARRGAVISHLDLLRGAGLRPQALEIGPAAIKRLIGALSKRSMPATVLVINFGRSKSYLTMISGRRLLFDQAVEFGEQGLLQRLSESLELSLEQSRDLVIKHGLDPGAHGGQGAAALSGREISETLAEIVKPNFLKLVDEINRTLIYAASETRGKPVTQVYMLGSVARWRGADALLGSLLSISVATIPDPLEPFRPQGDDGEGPEPAGVPEIAVATGLALRGMSGDE